MRDIIRREFKLFKRARISVNNLETCSFLRIHDETSYHNSKHKEYGRQETINDNPDSRLPVNVLFLRLTVFCLHYAGS